MSRHTLLGLLAFMWRCFLNAYAQISSTWRRFTSSPVNWESIISRSILPVEIIKRIMVSLWTPVRRSIERTESPSTKWERINTFFYNDNAFIAKLLKFGVDFYHAMNEIGVWFTVRSFGLELSELVGAETLASSLFF
jgi:hypothetical protein